MTRLLLSVASLNLLLLTSLATNAGACDKHADSQDHVDVLVPQAVQPKNLHIDLLLDQSNMIGSAVIPNDATGVLWNETESDNRLTGGYFGDRYAMQLIDGHKSTDVEQKPNPRKKIQFIDVHVHAHAVQVDGLDKVAAWMQRNNISRCIVSPLDHKGSRAYTEEERTQMLANYAKYKGKIDRMCLIEAGDFDTVDKAVQRLKQEMKDGAVAMGEHYGKGLNFDDPKNLLIYEACEKVGLPVMFHIDQNKNMVESGMQRVDNVLKKYPKCKIIAHAYWWRQLKDADRQLQEHPNLYADVSGHVVPQILGRDRKFAREFCIRNQDKILFGTDEGWWSFSKDKSPFQHYTFFEELDLPDEVRYKIYRGNAEKLFGWEKED